MKNNVNRWEPVATYVAQFDSDDPIIGIGAVDVEVQVGDCDGYYLRTTDDAGGSDECDGTRYTTRDAAIAAAEEFAAAHDDSNGNETASEYLRRMLSEAQADPDADGDWCAYWSTALDDSGPRTRYACRDDAEAAVALANEELHDAHPGGNLLCAFEVRVLVDGEWIRADDE